MMVGADLIVAEWLPENRNLFFGCLEISQKMCLRQVEQDLTSFFAKFFGIFYDFLKFRSSYGALHFEKYG